MKYELHRYTPDSTKIVKSFAKETTLINFINKKFYVGMGPALNDVNDYFVVNIQTQDCFPIESFI
jgi:hypothetical protein